MLINERTKISHLLKARPEALEAIISLSKNFRKLRNPILRKVMAARVNIAQAAELGGVTLREFLDKMEEVGFEVERSKDTAVPEDEQCRMEDLPDSTYELDVRPVIDEGRDPFRMIMDKVNTLHSGESLRIINHFKPTPLISVLEDKKYRTDCIKRSGDEYYLYVFKDDGQEEIKEESTRETEADEWEMRILEYGENLREIDVRMLEMPEPMVTILDELSRLPEGYGLLVHHKKVPQFLLPELKSRGYRWMTKEGENEVLMFIDK